MSNSTEDATGGAEHRSSSHSEDSLDGMTPSEELAYELARSDAELIYSLKETRIAQGLTEQQFATALGVSVESLRAFEGGQSALTLAGIRRYAHGLGVVIEHRIEPFEPGRSAEDRDGTSSVAPAESDGDEGELSAAAEAIRAARELQDERLIAALTAVHDHTMVHWEEFRPLSSQVLSVFEAEPKHSGTDGEQLQEDSPTREWGFPRNPAAVLFELRELLVEYAKTPSALYHSYHYDRLREMLAQLSVQG